MVLGTLCASLAACAAGATMPPAVNSAAIQSQLPALLEDAARRVGVPMTQLRVVLMQAVVWRDGAIGCPQPGRLYPQVLVPGHRVRIAAIDGASDGLDYHVSARGGWLFCPAGQAQPALPRDADPRI
jgi:hypothetical protein